jgi:hypothetical protein
MEIAGTSLIGMIGDVPFWASALGLRAWVQESQLPRPADGLVAA